jgi:NAD+ diphosphatase
MRGTYHRCMESPGADERIPNVYGTAFDRLAERRRDERWLAEAWRNPSTRVLALWGGRQPVIDTAEGPRLAGLPAGAVDGMEAARVLLGATGDRGGAWFAVDLDGAADQPPIAPPEGARYADLREVGAVLPSDEAALSATARGVLAWQAANRYCGRCGSRTRAEPSGHVLHCDGCGASHHPRIEPAVITLVTDGGDRCVLGRSRRHPPGMHSCFAGFVEPGESLEAAVAREVREEVGLEVSEVRYHSSQPWPFPAQLMIGFRARAKTFEIILDDDEIRSARWFTRDELLASPEDETLRLPRRDSLARRMVEDWLAAG